jgi:hypothetical protein
MTAFGCWLLVVCHSEPRTKAPCSVQTPQLPASNYQESIVSFLLPRLNAYIQRRLLITVIPVPMEHVRSRVAHQDIRSAGLKRWDGRRRITTDWVNIFHVCIIAICRHDHKLIHCRNLSSAGRLVIAKSTYLNQDHQAVYLPFEYIQNCSLPQASMFSSINVYPGTQSLPPRNAFSLIVPVAILKRFYQSSIYLSWKV